jgi:hypothetical protein
MRWLNLIGYNFKDEKQCPTADRSGQCFSSSFTICEVLIFAHQAPPAPATAPKMTLFFDNPNKIAIFSHEFKFKSFSIISLKPKP